MLIMLCCNSSHHFIQYFTEESKRHGLLQMKQRFPRTKPKQKAKRLLLTMFESSGDAKKLHEVNLSLRKKITKVSVYSHPVITRGSF